MDILIPESGQACSVVAVAASAVGGDARASSRKGDVRSSATAAKTRTLGWRSGQGARAAAAVPRSGTTKSLHRRDRSRSRGEEVSIDSFARHCLYASTMLRPH